MGLIISLFVYLVCVCECRSRFKQDCRTATGNVIWQVKHLRGTTNALFHHISCSVAVLTLSILSLQTCPECGCLAYSWNRGLNRRHHVVLASHQLPWLQIKVPKL